MRKLIDIVIQCLSLVSRFVNVIHGGKANETFSERTERQRHHRYFGAWRTVINAAFRLIGQHAHTTTVHYGEQQHWVDVLRQRGYTVHAPGFDPVREQA